MLRSIIQRDIKRSMERDLRMSDGEPQSLIYGTLTLPCTPTSLEESIDMDASGNETVIRHSVLLRTDLFNLPGLEPIEGQDADDLFASAEGLPRIDDEVRVRWQTYRVVRRHLDSTLATIRLDLADVASNR